VKGFDSSLAIQTSRREFDAAVQLPARLLPAGVLRVEPVDSGHESERDDWISEFFCEAMSASVPPSHASAITASALATIRRARLPLRGDRKFDMRVRSEVDRTQKEILSYAHLPLRATGRRRFHHRCASPFSSTAPRRAISRPSSKASCRRRAARHPEPISAITWLPLHFLLFTRALRKRSFCEFPPRGARSGSSPPR